MENVIFDTAGFLAGLENYFNKVYTTPQVVEEVRDSYSRGLLSLATSSGKVIVMQPERRNVEDVRNVLRKIGEYTLSQTDVSIIALAIQLKPSVVFTDDFSVQNVLARLNIKYNSVKLNKSVKIEKEYQYVCKNCGKVYRTRKDACEICGGEIIKTTKNINKIY
ncbi:MAG: nucleotide binding protein PINc [Candidatus Aramenus sulfurataquae]|jgi:UPF0271 protein|uniref:DNA-binding protein n=2 Tax=Candidatus Aramenus sulfurataquae TaxID=1326980 RepID=W7KW46_9CREN|nr:MAG: nucleotide binding protein PINc [Candidatus Aramenus sulfurataquae]MCL7343727.1 NOB1 family endonuclease [Candidatus Aramenus sulfurataquae]